MEKVFVYGTLKTGGTVRGLNTFGDGATIVGRATTEYPDYDMLDLGSFPGVVLGGQYKILGEVWEVDEETFQMLDGIEGYPTFYDRKLTHTTQGKAWMYVLNKHDYAEYPNFEDSNSIELHGDTLQWNLTN